MFDHAIRFDQDRSNWDTSQVADMYAMFYGAERFKGPLNNWDTSQVFNMSFVFKNATRFNQPLENWDTSRVTSMHDMFHGATSFDQDISSWNVENVKHFYDMFRDAGLSTPNYDALLISWSEQNVCPNVIFDAGKSVYTRGGKAEAARMKLVREKGWRIKDGVGDSSLVHLHIGPTISGECPICSETLEEGYQMRCNQEFSTECLTEWSKRNTTCPMCRTPL